MSAKTYKNGRITVSMGNSKLDKGIMIFNLPSVKTCPNCSSCAKSCYARKAEKLYPTVLPCRESNLEATKCDTFVARMVELINRSKARMVRIHESGDYYSQAYANKWAAIAFRCPGVLFYCYTKSPYRPAPHANLNIVESILPDGSINFGPKAAILAKAKAFRAKVCPYGHAKKAFVCGRECTACVTSKHVVFVQH